MKMHKREIGAICGIVTLAILLLLGVQFGMLSLNSVLSNASWFIFAGMVGLFLWGFRERIDLWFHKILPSSPTPHEPVVDSSTRIKPDEQEGQDEGLKHYKSRSELPPFNKMLSIANVTVDMSGLDFRIVVHQFMSVIRLLIHRHTRITFLLLDPNSEQVEIQSKSFHAVEDLKESIQKSIKLLCQEKEKLPPYMRGNLIIRLYDYPPQHGIIIIDDGHENAWIKVEARPVGSDSNSRPSDAWYKSYDAGRYTQFVNEFNILFKHSTEYACPP